MEGGADDGDAAGGTLSTTHSGIEAIVPELMRRLREDGSDAEERMQTLKWTSELIGCASGEDGIALGRVVREQGLALFSWLLIDADMDVRQEALLVLGNLGDSRMVLCRRSGEAKRLTTDHKPEEEAERIVAAGGFLQVVGGVARLEGDLSVSRAFGDREYKKAGGGSGALSAIPDVGVVDLLRADAAFLVLACDGVWDVYSDAEACDLVRTGLRQNEGDADAAASFLADCTVADARCTDNVTVVVVVLERRDAPELPAEAAAAPEPEAGQPP